MLSPETRGFLVLMLIFAIYTFLIWLVCGRRKRN